ncbi:MAG: hypothetical protein BWZ10_02458 [candidate division BRC1 bacterium ADurb.BinA364]|nr:MAG: hypothetical protein BWZ10_02458 [candidate division BRC1 bacterium ADurb.BinA364]
MLGDSQAKALDAFGAPKTDRPGAAIAKRTVFLIDKEGIVRFVDLDYNIEDDKETLYAAMEQLAHPPHRAE